MSLPLTDDFRDIVLNRRPLIDVRAPIEFEKGAFPAAVNLPLMSDEERHEVGICYKEKGHDAAVELGHTLVQGKIKEQRVSAWRAFIDAHPNAYLYCFRGGQRSGISQQWLADAGIEVPRLEGGYKAFRNYLSTEAEAITAKTETLIVGGRTGSGKTILLQKLENMIDLEGLANHRGSSFGRFTTPQPAQIDFEDELAYQLIHFDNNGYNRLVIEHESHNIGRIFIPKPIYENFTKGSLIILETPIEERTQITYDEYVVSALQEHKKAFGDEGDVKWFESIDGGLDRIKKRLGSERYLALKNQLADAFEVQQKSGDTEAHKSWVEVLLHEYYDPMYDYQIEKSPIPVIFRGNKEEVLAFIKAQS